MRISDWSSDVCSSDLRTLGVRRGALEVEVELVVGLEADEVLEGPDLLVDQHVLVEEPEEVRVGDEPVAVVEHRGDEERRSEEHTSELQSLMRISYAVFCLQKTNNT